MGKKALPEQMDVVVDVLTNSTGQIVERYSHNFNPHYADFRVRFISHGYRIVRQRHLRTAMTGEKRKFFREMGV